MRKCGLLKSTPFASIVVDSFLNSKPAYINYSSTFFDIVMWLENSGITTRYVILPSKQQDCQQRHSPNNRPECKSYGF